MKISIGLAILMVACALAASMGPEDEKEITDEKGKVIEVSTDRFGIVPDSNEYVRYAPSNLPDEFKRDGLRVVFSGKVGEIDPNIRMWGTPFELTKIEVLE